MMNSCPSIITPSLISSIRRHPYLPRNTWYFIAATTLSILNRPDEIQKVYTHAIAHGGDYFDVTPSEDEQRSISRRIREALIKSSAVSGVPKVRFTIGLVLDMCMTDHHADHQCPA